MAFYISDYLGLNDIKKVYKMNYINEIEYKERIYFREIYLDESEIMFESIQNNYNKVNLLKYKYNNKIVEDKKHIEEFVYEKLENVFINEDLNEVNCYYMDLESIAKYIGYFLKKNINNLHFRYLISTLSANYYGNGNKEIKKL